MRYNWTECFVIYIFTVQHTECQQEKTLISILLLRSGQTAAAFFSASEQKQTSFPEDRVQRNSLPNFFINSGCKLSSVCTEDARHHADNLYLFIYLLLDHGKGNNWNPRIHHMEAFVPPGLMDPCLQVVTQATCISCKMLHCYGVARQPLL